MLFDFALVHDDDNNDKHHGTCKHDGERGSGRWVRDWWTKEGWAGGGGRWMGAFALVDVGREGGCRREEGRA